MADLYFAVEGGRALEMAKQHVRARQDQHARNVALLEGLNTKEYVASILDGTVVGVRFDGVPHPDFKKANSKGWSAPKKNTEWAKRFEENPGYDARGYELAEALGGPTVLKYSSSTSRGMTHISKGFSSGVGFLWLGEDGPFALYIPDVQAMVAQYEEGGYTVCPECKHFAFQLDGARPILKEEWELTVAKHKLDRAIQGEAA